VILYGRKPSAGQRPGAKRTKTEAWRAESVSICVHLWSSSRQTMTAFWSALEQMPGLNAIPSAWISLMGPAFGILQASFFRKQPEPAQACFCEKCYCAHEVVRRGAELPAPPAARLAKLADQTTHPDSAALPLLVAVCRCESGRCPDIPLLPADIEIWELSWTSLGRTLCRALDLDPRSAQLPLYNT